MLWCEGKPYRKYYSEHVHQLFELNGLAQALHHSLKIDDHQFSKFMGFCFSVYLTQCAFWKGIFFIPGKTVTLGKPGVR